MIKKILQILLISAIISSCGFQVIYDEKQSGISYEQELAAIKIQKSSGRLSQELRNTLHYLFNPDFLQVEPKYILTLTISDSISSTFTTTTGSSGRNRVTVTVKYNLLDLKTGKSIAEGTTNVGDNYDVQNNRYGTYTAENYTKLNVLKIAAQNIRNLLVNDIIEAKKLSEERFLKK